jgi:hypothetical protein
VAGAVLDHVTLKVGDFGAFVLDPDGNNIEALCHAAA